MAPKLSQHGENENRKINRVMNYNPAIALDAF
jgi:hypothetical protein